MPDGNAKIKRDNLVQEILSALSQWPELERRIFTQAHYHGRSLETISRSLRLDVEEVSFILKQCDHQLHTCLREFCISSCAKPSPIPAETAGQLPVART